MSEIKFNLLGKILFGEATPEEKKTFETWLNESAENREIFEAYRDFCDNTTITDNRPEGSVAGDDESPAPVPLHGEQKLGYPYWAAAAAVALLVAFILYVFTPPFAPSPHSLAEVRLVVKTNGKGKKSKISLPDGSTVWLNAGSSLAYPENFSDTLREITLTGEAYFEVHRDTLRPFIVEAGHLKTTVLGTSFNISSYAEDDVADVSLVTGKLNVTQETHSEILLPGNGVSFHQSNQKLTLHAVDIHKIGRWKEGILVFDHEPLQAVIADLERWYDVKITLPGEPLPDWKFTGSFDNESLRNVLEVLCFGKNLNYKILNKDVTLTRQH